jgi:site-specific DNA recombinase
MKAVLYARKSNPDERNVDHQLDVLRAAAAGDGREVLAEFKDDGKSAFKLDGKRPGYDAMVERATAGDVDVVMVVDLDRLARRNNAGLVALDRAGVQVGDASGRVFSVLELYLKLGVAYEESAVKAKRQLRAEDRRVADGRPPRGGFRHFGYHGGDPARCGCDGPCTRHAVREDEAAVLHEIAARWLAGEPLHGLARELNDRGVPTVRGGPWTRTGLRKLLLSPRLAALRTHTRDGVTRTVPGAWQPIFDRDLHARLVASSPRDRRAPDRYLLTGLIYCGRCGGDQRLNGKQHARGRRRYTCLACNRNGIGADAVDDAVWNLALGRSWHADRTNEARAEDRLKHAESALRKARTRAAEIDASFADGDLSHARWVAMADRAATRVRRLEDEHARLREEAGRARNEWLALIALAGEYRDAPPDRRRSVLEAVVRRVVLAPNAGRAGGRVDLSRITVHWVDGEVTRLP